MTPAELDDRVRDALKDSPIDAPVDEGFERVTLRHRRHRFKRRATGLVAAALATLVLAGVIVASRGASNRAQEVITTPDETTSTTAAPNTKFPPLVDMPVMVDTPAVEDPAIQLSPAGPYVDGQEITVTVPSRYAGDWSNEGTPRLCMVLSEIGGEVCDPTAFVPSYDRISTAPEGDVARYVLRRSVFSPNGWRDCNDEGVTCRLVVLRADGSYRASQQLVFAGPPVPPSAILTIDPALPADGDVVRVSPHGLTSDGLADARGFASGSRPAAPEFGLLICAYEPRRARCFAPPDMPPMDSTNPNAPVEFVANREYFGRDGWRDCALVPCFLRVSATYQPYWHTSAAAPLPIDRTAAAALRPTMVVTPDGPYTADQAVTVRVENLPAGVFGVALCRAGDATACFSQALPLPDDGAAQANVILFRRLGDETLPTGVVDCALEPCVLAIRPPGESANLTELPLVFDE